MKDVNGKELTPEELHKILYHQGTHPQYNWWKAKVPPRAGHTNPPPGVRQNVKISKL